MQEFERASFHKEFVDEENNTGSYVFEPLERGFGKMCIRDSFYTGADSMVQDGGFATVGIDYEELGKETANMVDQILNGTSVSDIPVKVFKDNLNIYINQNALDTLGIQLSDDIKNNDRLIMVE